MIRENVFLPLHSRRGFSLAETLISVLVFTIGVYGLLRLTAVSSSAQQRYENRFKAMCFAQSQMARLRAAGSTALQDEVRSGAPTLPLSSTRPTSLDNRLFWEVTVRSVEGDPELAEVRVIVSWSTQQPVDRDKPPVYIEKFEIIETLAPRSEKVGPVS